PDPEFSHVALTPEGGHPGKDHHQAAVRRWIAPESMTLSIEGMLNHPQKLGDGVEGIIVSSRAGIIGRWTAHKSEVETKIESVEVHRGDTLDFVTDLRGSQDFDSFRWSVTLRNTSGSESGMTTVWKSQVDFAGPQSPSLNPWQKYVQVLLLANEFAFID